MTVENVTINYQPGSAPSFPWSTDWGTAADITDYGQPIDGRWMLDGGGVRTVEIGYDRLIGLGDVAWGDMELTVPVTVHGPSLASMHSQAAVGLAFRWQGHSAENAGDQPGSEIYPLGGLPWYRFKGAGQGYRIDIVNNPQQSSDVMPIGVTTMMKVRGRDGGERDAILL